MINNPKILDWIDDIDAALVRYFNQKDNSAHPLDRAMEYTLLAGGKRLRPLLTMLVVDAFDGDGAAAMPIALASELLHTYSLIHDDLPCMDNDDMRRGKPTNHIVFGEANAILAGDALQAEAFAILADHPFPGLSDSRRVRILSEFAAAVGRQGMVAGQVMDLGQEGEDIDLDRLKLLHGRKTGALLRFCIRMGAHLADVDEDTLTKLTTYANAVGLLFQVVDDLLDEEATSETLGKTAGKDADAHKATFPRLMDAKAAHQFADDLLTQALTALDGVTGRTDHLREVARFIRRRDH